MGFLWNANLDLLLRSLSATLAIEPDFGESQDYSGD
jgi:hypothetical protein